MQLPQTWLIKTSNMNKQMLKRLLNTNSKTNYWAMLLKD